MKKKSLAVLILLILWGCQARTTETTEPLTTTIPPTLLSTTSTMTDIESPCKDTPLAEGCFVPSSDLNHLSPVHEEFTITETFDDERVNQQPKNWLLYSNSEYLAGGVYARVEYVEDNGFVRLFSDGAKKPPYPQGAATPTFIFTSKFNLDQTKAGSMAVSLMVPDTNNNSVSAGVSTGAVNTISVTIDNDYSVFVKVGGPYYYYSGTGDGGTYYPTDIVVQPNTWIRFKFTWDAADNLVQAYFVDGVGETLLVAVPFHVSNRFNATAEGAILVPNLVRVTMPYGQSGIAYLDECIVERSDGE
jgi:hypothetical protein